MIVRKATYDDISEMLPMGKAFYDATDLSEVGLEYEAESLRQHMEDFIEDEQGAAIIVAEEEDGHLSGCIAGFRVPWYLKTTQSIGIEQWWWVMPQHRIKGVGKALKNAFETWAKKGATHSLMGDIGTAGAIGEWYKKDGYRPIETHFYKRLVT